MAASTIVLITGGNTGIGYETVKALYASPEAHTILMGSRSLEKANDAISTLKSEVTETKSTVEAVQIDIESDNSINAALEVVKEKYGRIDALVNNAGGSFDPLLRTDPSTPNLRHVWNASYSLNVTSTQVCTHIFMPLLLLSPSPRLLFLTSGLSSLTTCSGGLTSKALAPEPPKKGWPKDGALSMIAYRSSKTALNMMMLDWVRMLEPDGVKVFCISPGFLATGLGGMGREFMKKVGAGEPSVGGRFVRDVVEGKRDADQGVVINKDGVQPW